MRAFAWLLVVAGLVLAIGWGSYGLLRERAPVCDLVEARGPERRLPDLDSCCRDPRCRRAAGVDGGRSVARRDRGRGVTALGIIVLAIRRPERAHD